MSKTKAIILILVLIILILVGVTVYAVSNYGSQSDPLITKSYLDQVVGPQLEEKLQEQLDSAMEQLREATPGEFQELTLSAGQTLSCSVGCEVLLRSGSATAVGEAVPALLDTTEGGGVNALGALTAYHMYMAAEEGCGLMAGDSGATVLVCGVCTVS